MKTKNMVALLATVMLLTACEPISHTLPVTSIPEVQMQTEYESVAEETETEPETVSYTEYVAEVPEIVNAEANMVIEAEECSFGGSLYISDERKGFSGEGYITGFYGGSADSMKIDVNIDVNQHYDITICVAADSDITHNIKVNDSPLQEFEITGDGNFTMITIPGVFLEEGLNQIQIDSCGENFDFDYLKVTNNETIYDTSFELEETAVSENTASSTEILLKAMKTCFGKKILTGQYASSDKNIELEMIYKITGKYPAIRFGDISGQSMYDSKPSETEIQAAVDWSERGGIVGFMWHWKSPIGDEPSVYAKDTEFSLAKAVTQTEIAQLPISEIEDLYESGDISEECFEIIKDIDDVSNSFMILKEKNIPILWRPLHEASGEWFWWGASGADAYKWLYNLMYDRMTKYHKLDNLIWIWNGQSKEYLVDADRFDIAAVDIYLSPDIEYGSRSEQFLWLKEITNKGKLLALSECSTIPSIDDMCRDNALWSFFGLWFGEYIIDKNGELSEKYTPKEEFIKMYNAENTITLENYSGGYAQ